MSAILIILFAALPLPLPPRTCAPGMVYTLSSCNFDVVRTCDADVACETPLLCWAVTQRAGRRSCEASAMKFPPNPSTAEVSAIIEEMKEAASFAVSERRMGR